LSSETLLQKTARRFSAAGFAQPTYVVADRFHGLLEQQCKQAGCSIGLAVLEPVSRDTAPAVLAAALLMPDPDVVMVVSAADQEIPDEARFRACLQRAYGAAQAGQLVSVGVIPDRPETGYGYMRYNPSADPIAAPVPLLEYVEKPNLKTATDYLQRGCFLWNAGVFMLTPRALVSTYQEFCPEIVPLVQAAVAGATSGSTCITLSSEPWTRIDAISIDHAVMEKAGNQVLIGYDGAWADLGSWQSLWREASKDENGVGTDMQSLALECQNSLLRSTLPGQRLVGIGLTNMAVIATPDAILVMPTAWSEELASMIKQQDLLKLEDP
jgi:mannose-1-phosphate guanylyltransferase/mannose-6-phosphate isomerase